MLCFSSCPSCLTLPEQASDWRRPQLHTNAGLSAPNLRPSAPTCCATLGRLGATVATGAPLETHFAPAGCWLQMEPAARPTSVALIVDEPGCRNVVPVGPLRKLCTLRLDRPGRLLARREWQLVGAKNRYTTPRVPIVLFADNCDEFIVCARWPNSTMSPPPASAISRPARVRFGLAWWRPRARCTRSTVVALSRGRSSFLRRRPPRAGR